MVQYNYNAWGEHTVSGSNTTLGNLNPFRYRGYFYDTQTKLYYLQSRYYDPETGRFISMDNTKYADPETINGLNLYAYCNNNPVMRVDPDGTDSWGLMGFIADYFSTVPLAAIAAFARTNRSLYKSINSIAGSVGKMATVVGAVLTVVEAGVSIYEGISSGQSVGRVISDTAVDVGISIGTIALASAITGAIAGSAVPVVGNLIGFGVGLAVGVGVYLVDTFAPQVRQTIKDIVYDTATTIISEVNYVINEIDNFFNNIGNTVAGWFGL